ncbi:endonuclease V [Halorarum salinum]|uniref:Endonuclease V n=1 Tax=Halorarum salinum TaxID=2743089 RepID=A0A7D5L883_9EURY|nr:endonuclease V [Halobaculum salinum]QLG60566.1 endonuclease V [Halobaculum salinum]
MPDVVRPEFRPDPSLSREAMEALQRDVAAAAVFEDDLGFDPAAVRLDAGQRSLATGVEPAAGADATDGTNTADAAARFPDPPLVAGIDQAFLDDRAVSAVVVTRGSEVVERTYAVSPLDVPYIPGLLSFREGGPVLDALATLDAEPDLYVLDGSGRVHFREAGIATHVGVMLDAPAVGVAKSLLCGRLEEEPDGRPAGWRTPILANGRVTAPEGTVIGYAYQSRQYDTNPVINPLYVSPGHRVSAETTVDLVAGLCDGYKLPEPTRLADSYADDAKREVRKG